MNVSSLALLWKVLDKIAANTSRINALERIAKNNTADIRKLQKRVNTLEHQQRNYERWLGLEKRTEHGEYLNG